MKFVFPSEVRNILAAFKKNGYDIFVIGGAVRDILLSKIVYDWDFTTNATPEEMLKFLPDAYYTNKFGTVGIPAKRKGGRPYEITTYRTEHGYSDSRRPDKVRWGKSLEEDLKRRDFTINAMAISQTKKTNAEKFPGIPSIYLIDLFGGKKDLGDKVIKAVGDPHERFSEDALRMLRAVRIAAELGFTIEKETISAIEKNSHLIKKIAKERVRDEFLKILTSYYPYQGMVILRNSGLLQQILPELLMAFEVEQKSPGRHHIYDVGTHCMNSLKEITKRNKDPIVRLAALMHDIGKAQTYKKLETGVVTFYDHELASARTAKKLAQRLNFSKNQTERLYRLVRYHQFTVDENQTDSAIRRFIRNVGPENISDMLDLRVADRIGGGAKETSWRLEEFKKRLIEVQKQPFSVSDLKISGHDVMEILNIKPGPKVGEVLGILYEEVVNKKLANEKKTLTKHLGKIKASS